MEYLQTYSLLLLTLMMKIPSKLVEHVAGRIVRRLKSLFPATTMVRVNVKKVAPPMPYDMNGAGVEICCRF